MSEILRALIRKIPESSNREAISSLSKSLFQAAFVVSFFGAVLMVVPDNQFGDFSSLVSATINCSAC